MKRSILLCALLLAACGSDETDTEQTTTEHGAIAPADTSLEGTPMIGVVPEVRERARQAEDDMAERARQAEEQVRAAESGTAQP
jgi:hypothetical protein